MKYPAKKSPQNMRHVAYVLLIITIAIWGIATVVVRATITYIPPFSFLMVRFWIAGLLLLPAMFYYFHKYNLSSKRLKHLFIAALIGNVIALTFMFLGLARTTAIQASLISSVSPLIVAFLGFFILKEIITKKEIEGTLTAFIGTLVIIIGPILMGIAHLNGNKALFIGNILFFLGVLFDALYIIYVKKHIVNDKLITPLMTITFTFIFAAILVTPMGIIEQYKLYSDVRLNTLPVCTQGDIDKHFYGATTTCDNSGCYTEKETDYYCKIKEINPTFSQFFANNIKGYFSTPAIYGLIYMALISGILAYTIYNKALKYVEASEASVFYYLQPLFAVPIAMIFLSETITIVFIIGAIITAIGIYMAEKR